MQRIVLSVEDKVAQKWQTAAPERQAQIIALFSLLLEKQGRQPFNKQDFSKLLDRLSDQVQINGLTPEILKEILHEF